jgi:hypothetical protein
MSDEAPDASALDAARLRVPENVVLRSFDTETILLNLTSGSYHGLNKTAGQMLEVLAETGSFSETAKRVAADVGEPLERITADLTDLCNALMERGLIETDQT